MIKYYYRKYGRNGGRVSVERWVRINVPFSNAHYVERKQAMTGNVMWKIGTVNVIAYADDWKPITKKVFDNAKKRANVFFTKK